MMPSSSSFPCPSHWSTRALSGSSSTRAIGTATESDSKTAADLDEELAGWLCASYRLIGQQERFKSP